MGQKDRARAIVDELYEFDAETDLDAQGVLAAAERAAASSQTSMKGGVELIDHQISDAWNFDAAYVLKGPGRMVKVMGFVISGQASASGRLLVSMRVGDFLFQKGSLGMKPSINGHKVIGAFVQVLQSELAVGAAATPVAATADAAISPTETAAAPHPEPAPEPTTATATATADPAGPAADWYPDPGGTARLRYWDGTQWTAHTAE